MMKLCLNLLLLCMVVTTGANAARSQQASKALLNPPGWILGSWSNLAESNLDRLETFAFTADEISFTKGMLDKSKVVNFSSKFKGYKVKETVEPKTYRVEVHTDEDEFIYEFKLCEMDACKAFSGKEALTYSIIKNGKIIRTHMTSVQLVLFRPVSVN